MAKKETSVQQKVLRDPNEIEVFEVNKGFAKICVIGTQPILLNRLSEKSKHALLMPAPRLTTAEKSLRLKHKPMEEFTNAPYRMRDDAPTLLGVLSAAFKKGMMSAALEIPGMKKAQIGRLVWVLDQYTCVYGIPQLHMSTVRMADINHTPDIRTRVIIPRWCAELSIEFVMPMIRAQAVVRLLHAAGLFIGCGDWRNEKGSGTCGSYELVEPDDPRYIAIVAEGGREAQRAAMKTPEMYDQETADLMGWFDEELDRRQEQGRADKKKKEVAA